MTSIRTHVVHVFPLERRDVAGATATARTYTRPEDLGALPPDHVFMIRLQGTCGMWLCQDGTSRTLDFTQAGIWSRDDAAATLADMLGGNARTLEPQAVALDGERAILATMIRFMERYHRVASRVRHMLARDVDQEQPYFQAPGRVG